MTILEAWNVALSQLMEFVARKSQLEVQQRCKYVILAPLQYPQPKRTNRPGSQFSWPLMTLN